MKDKKKIIKNKKESVSWWQWPILIGILIIANFVPASSLPAESVMTSDGSKLPSDTTIKNRRGVEIVLTVDSVKKSRGTVIIENGLGETRQGANLTALAEAANRANFNAVRFDPANTGGASEGSLSYALPSNYYQDMEDVVHWVWADKTFSKPLYLAGHSLGAMSAASYAINYPNRVAGLVLISTAVSGKSQFEWLYRRNSSDWEQLTQEVTGLMGRSRKSADIDWLNFMVDFLQVDITSQADQIKAPVLMISGEYDQVIPIEAQKEMYDALKMDKEFYTVPGAGHMFNDEAEITAITDTVAAWLEKQR